MIAIDTSVMVGAIQTFDSEMHSTARRAVKSLYKQGERMVCFPQNLVEFWNVATRPVKSQGLGLKAEVADDYVERIQTVLGLLPETPEIFPFWQMLVLMHRMTGIHVHDARIVAAMTAHRVGKILTFDQPDFVRYPGITVMHPSDVKQ